MSGDTEWPAKGCELYGHTYRGRGPCGSCGAPYVELTDVEELIAAAVKYHLHDEAGRDEHAREVGRAVGRSLAKGRYAVVKLPDPYEAPPDVHHPYWSVDDVNGPQVVGVEESDAESTDELVSIQFSARYRTVDVPTARALGAAFLAAADAAER